MPLKSGSAHSILPMHQRSAQKNANQMQEREKVPFVLAKRIREAILDEVFKPGDRLTEAELVEKFEVSRSPVREALLALEKEGTIIISPFKGAIVKPLSPEEVLDIAELRLGLITLVAKPAYRYLSPADFDLVYGLAKHITATNNAKEHFEFNRRFWDILFGKAGRPILLGGVHALGRSNDSLLSAFFGAFSYPGEQATPTGGSHRILPQRQNR
jgi:DNA-binding GntR family transcriptional regulator